MSFDLIIRGGTVVDGSGAAPRMVDLGIVGERIEALDDLSAATAPLIVDATDLIVAPGFIDAHAHSDAYLLLEPAAPSKIRQGITTEINGQCGGAAVPCLGTARLSSDWASQIYPRLGGMAANAPGPTWTTVASYRALFEQVQPALNSVQLIGHNILRAGVMGYEPRAATSDELLLMERRLEQALDEGGAGLSSGLLYVPGKHAAPGEVDALARIAARRGRFYASHIRSEGTELLESIQELLGVARRTGVQLQLSHFKTSGAANWHKLEAAIELLESARAQGIHVTADRYPYLAAGTDLDIVLPEWAASGGRDTILAALRDPAQFSQLAAELDASARDWSKVMIGGGWSDAVRYFSGSTIAEAAEMLQVSPGNAVCQILIADETRTGGFFFGMSRDNLRRICALEWVMPGSDASLRAPWGPLSLDHPHPRAYGTMPRFLQLLTEPPALCDLPTAIQRMTALPAHTFGLTGRGRLARGNFADIIVFDESQFRDRATYAQPHQFARGMLHVIVNGALTYSDGCWTGQRRGRFLAPA